LLKFDIIKRKSDLYLQLISSWQCCW